ncbi:unnamed protein product [Cercospora beticola]|nr:unnamed protein product [Cercospora beticola]
MQFISTALLLSSLAVVFASPQAPNTGSDNAQCSSRAVDIIQELCDGQPGCKLDSCKLYSLNLGDDCMAICNGKTTKGGKCVDVQGNFQCCFGLFG